MNYKGWRIIYIPVGALHWRAKRFGVSLTAGSKAAVKELIDRRLTF
jgi:hypothetical protein